MNKEMRDCDFHNLDAVQVRFIESYLERPPKVRLVFDIVLRNEMTEPRWFLLPDKATLAPEQVIGPIETVEVYRLEGKGNVIVGHFRGSGGFHAIYLPGNAEVTLRQFPILTWSPPCASIVIEAVIANRLMIADEPGEYWFEMNAMSDARADVQADVLAEQKRVIAGKSAPSLNEVPVTITNDQHIRMKVNLI